MKKRKIAASVLAFAIALANAAGALAYTRAEENGENTLYSEVSERMREDERRAGDNEERLRGEEKPEEDSAELLDYEILTEGDYEYTVKDDGTAEITQYSGTAEKLTIPSTLGGNKVTSIGEGAFEECIELTNVAIPEWVTSIGPGAFYNCYCLSDVEIPDGVTYIGREAFTGTEIYNNNSR